MRGVAEQRRRGRSVQRAIGSRSAVAQRFQLFGRSSSWRGARADAVEVATAPRRGCLRVTPHSSALAAVEGDDDVVLVAAAQRVVHEVAVRARPRRTAAFQLQVRPGSRRRRRPRGRRRGRRRAPASPTNCCAHRRLHAVAADQRRRRVAAAVARRTTVDAARRPARRAATRVEVSDLDAAGRAATPSSSDGCTSARWITAYGLPKRCAERVADRDRARPRVSSTASIITIRSV